MNDNARYMTQREGLTSHTIIDGVSGTIFLWAANELAAAITVAALNRYDDDEPEFDPNL
ncbi:MAG: hypothetical protein HQ567_19965 [Candidatus Nealsonbacteria bacterium]|nr:hypothetical protein [Candidatus Nealsonbacteria bacterium]